MHPAARRLHLSAVLIGWAIFILGVIWDLVYHASLFVITNLPPALDLIGGLGHAVTFAGVVVLIYGLLRRQAK